MRIMGLDIGDSRIGVAVSDPLGILASPLTIINRSDDETAAGEIAGIIREKAIEKVVAGLPLNMDGTRGAQAEKTEAFINLLRGRIKLPVEFRDERLSTVTARERLAQTRKTGKATRYDAAAAAIILQSYLDETNPQTLPPE
jgi:putative Holliday junction resolvase